MRKWYSAKQCAGLVLSPSTTALAGDMSPGWPGEHASGLGGGRGTECSSRRTSSGRASTVMTVNAAGLAAVLEVVGELRAAIDTQERVHQSGQYRARVRVEELWTDLGRLLDEQQQEEVRRYDGWLKRVEDELDKGGNVKHYVELGMKLATQRAAVVRLDARTAIPPGPDPEVIAAIVEYEARVEPKGI